MYLIIGGNGFLGSYLIKNILAKTKELIISTYNSGEPFLQDKRVDWFKYNVADSQNIDLLQAKLKNANEKIKCIYLAGYIKSDDVEKNPSYAWKKNIAGLTTFINYCLDYIDILYFASTDMVMGESINDYKFKETDIPKPVNRYGNQKRICEQIVNDAGYNVFRCPLLIGKSLSKGRLNFVDCIEKDIKEGKKFEVLSDYFESSLDYNTVAKILVELIEKYGAIEDKIIHISGDDKISKLDIAQKFCEMNNLDNSLLTPITLKECKFLTAKRCDILLDNTLIKKYLNKDTIKLWGN